MEAEHESWMNESKPSYHYDKEWTANKHSKAFPNLSSSTAPSVSGGSADSFIRFLSVPPSYTYNCLDTSKPSDFSASTRSDRAFRNSFPHSGSASSSCSSCSLSTTQADAYTLTDKDFYYDPDRYFKSLIDGISDRASSIEPDLDEQTSIAILQSLREIEELDIPGWVKKTEMTRRIVAKAGNKVGFVLDSDPFFVQIKHEAALLTKPSHSELTACVESQNLAFSGVQNSQILENDNQVYSTYWADHVTIHPLSGRLVCLHCNTGTKFDNQIQTLDIEDVFTKDDAKYYMVTKVDQRISHLQNLMAEVVEAAKRNSIETALRIYFNAERNRCDGYYYKIMHHLHDCPRRFPKPLVIGIMNSVFKLVIDVSFQKIWCLDRIFQANYVCKANLDIVLQRMAIIINMLESAKHRIISNPDVRTGEDFIAFESGTDSAKPMSAWKKAVNHNIKRFLDLWPENEGPAVIWYKKG